MLFKALISIDYHCYYYQYCYYILQLLLLLLFFLLLQESQELINKCQQQERKISSWNKQSNNAGDVSPSEVPPAPLLIYRSSSMLVFKTAPFNSMGGKKVGHDFVTFY